MSDQDDTREGGELRRKVRLVRKKIEKRKKRLILRVDPAADAPEGRPAPERDSGATPPQAAPDSAPGREPRVVIEEDFEDKIDPRNPAEGVKRMVGSIVESILPDLLKRVVASGADAISEESVQELIDDIPLPKEDETFGGPSSGIRKEFRRVLTAEIQRFLQTINVSGEMRKLLTSMTFEIRTEIRFKPSEEGLEPSIKNKVRVKR